jgi:hypothetical protein
MPSTPSIQSEIPSQTNIAAHLPFTAAVNASKAQPAPHAVNMWTAKAAALRAAFAPGSGVSESMLRVYMLT